MEAAVVSASHGAMGSLIAKLGDLVTAEYKLLKEAKGQILFLKAELESMHVFLKKISDTEQPEEQDKHWAKEVRELSYDIEDSVNEFILRVESKASSKPHGFKGFINRSTKLLTIMNIRHEIFREFEDLEVRVVQVRERHRCQQTDDVASRPTNTTINYQGSTTRIDLEGTPVDESMEPKALPLSLLEEITDSFSQYHEISRGGFAVVYRGILETGTVVAVKKLSNAYMHEKEFQREVECLMSVRHKNIVRFLGYCADTQGSMQLYNKKYVMADVQQRLLCFEYVPKGSLHDYITDASCGLPWRKRYQIIKGVCEGLNYLHMNHVVHLDLKPANILMDDNMELKIADFGLSRCFDEGQGLIMATKVTGTPGYLPPEYNNRAVTRHYDIYSLGVIITETLTGKRGYYAIEDVLDSWRSRFKESLEYTELEQIRVCANIGKECAEQNPEKRPRSVQHIIDRLKETESAKESSLEMARERRLRYQQTDDVASRKTNTTIDIRLLAMYAEASGLVGIDGPRDELIQLMGVKDVPTHQLKVLSIVGFGGLGKTTLAIEIYRKLQGEFQCRAFVSVSQKPSIRKLLKTMLSQVGFVAPKDTNMELWKDSEFISVLREILRKQRYLIVIDDIWEASDWNIIRCALPENINGSRVLVTTRIETVARVCCTKNIECVYKMKTLSDQDSRSLLFKRIFGSGDGCPPYLKEVSAQILKKCGGLPLAIVTTSSLITSRSSKLKEHWEYVRDSLGSNLGMRQILNLSYINLPHYLKTCMLYLGIYPKDYIIDKNDLARRWIAEGFICKVRGVDLEDIAESYFNELINRSLIQPADTNYNGEVMSCRLHDMMLDLILHKSQEENFITVIDDIRDMTGHQNKIRRLSLNLDGAVGDSVAGSVQLSQTRTLAIFGTSSYLPPFHLFKHLRVLGIEITVRPETPLLLDFTEICHLFQLRSLKIIALGCEVVLPSKIGSMQQLETFEINASITLSKGQSFHELPSDIVHLSRLLHLIIPNYIVLPNGISNMKSLCTLHCFNLRNARKGIKGLGELTNLTNLEIIGDPSEIANDEIVENSKKVLQTCLGKLCNLKYLHVSVYSRCGTCFDSLNSTPASFHRLQIFHGYIKFSRVPGWIIQLHNLYDLCLTVKQVFEKDVGILAQLPSVINLVLSIKGTPEDKIIIRGNGFPVLKHFTFSCSRISCLAFVAGAMPKLEKLELQFNAKGWDRYGAAPIGTERLSSLREIYIGIGGGGAKESNRRAAESALRNAIDMHPGRLIANFECPANFVFGFEDVSINDEREEQEKDVSGGST